MRRQGIHADSGRSSVTPEEVDGWIADPLSIPRPAPEYADILEGLSEGEFNSIIDHAEWMLDQTANEGDERYDAIRVTVVARLIFGADAFTEDDLTTACLDDGVSVVATSIIGLAQGGIRL